MKIIRDIAYATARIGHRSGGTGEVTLAYDAYLPDAKPLGAVVLAFGGAFHRGSKEDDAFPGAGDTGTNTAMAEYCRHFALQGFAAYSVQYRLAPQDPVPPEDRVLGRPDEVPLGRIAQVREIMGLPPMAARDMADTMEAAIADMAAAVLHIRGRAAEDGFDPARMVIGGWSAGARCALYAAYARRVPCAGVLALSGAMPVWDVAAHVAPGAPPLLMISAERDIGYIREGVEPTLAAFAERGVATEHVTVPGWDHWYPGDAPAAPGGTVAGAMLGFVQRCASATDLALLERFADAYNRHDLDALLGLMTEDGVFETASGPDACGTRHAGRAALAASLGWAWSHWPDASWTEARHAVSGERGFSEWTFRGTDASGKRTEVRGVDLFELRDGRIARKDSYRKQRT
jgi:steroid delta-isomerase-like uncharacterized protein